MSQQSVLAAQKANRILSYVKRREASWARAVIFILCSCETPAGAPHPAPGSPRQEKHEAVRVGEEEGHENSGQGPRTYIL